MIRIGLLCWLLLAASFASAQSLPSHPDSARIVTSDIDNFWRAFDRAAPKFKAKLFQESYLDQGSPGIAGFLRYRIENAKKLAKTIRENEAYYRAVRPYTLRIAELEPEIRKYYHSLEAWYPDAVFPPAYFVIGRRNSGGTTSPEALIMGAEKFGDPGGDPAADIDFANIPGTVAHELIHYQQRYPGDDQRLIVQVIREGSADFLAALITDSPLDEHNLDDFARPKAAEIREMFRKEKDKTDWAGWLYGGNRRLFPDAPNDIGYWLGFQITAAYYAQAEDKHQAVYDILNIEDFDRFLEESGF